MKNRIQPTNRERKLTRDSFIVSKTDVKGRITYANRTFMEISGYSERELLGVQHNIIRHPDMPRSVFKLLWDTILAGQECFAYVKNLCRNGDFYWVFANVSPNHDLRGNLIGYNSARRLPSEAALAVVEPIYREMLAAEKAAGPKQAIEAGSQVLQKHLERGNQDYEAFVLGLQG